MKLIVSKDELFSKLASIQGIIEKRSTTPILSHFLLNATKEGATITATDLEIALKQPLNADVSKDGSMAVPARKLFEIVRELKGDILLESADGQWLKVKSGASHFRIACMPSEDFPELPSMESAEEFQVSSELLSKMIEKTLYAAGEADTRYTLNGLLFHLKPDSLTVVGTDGHRLSLITESMTTGVSDEKKLILPRKAAGELRKLLEGTELVTLRAGSNHMVFSINGITFFARLIEGTYPNYQQVIPKNDKQLTANKEALVSAIRKVSVVSKDRSNAVRIDLSGGSMKFSASSPDVGEAEDVIEVNYSGEELAIGFNARYLLDALSAVDGEDVAVELKDGLSPTLIKGIDDDTYKCVVMPMRI